MQRKIKVRLVALFYVPIVFGLCIFLAYQFPYWIEKILRLSSYGLTVCCLIVPWLSWSSYRIHSPHSTPHYGFIRWYVTLAAIEIGLISLFFIQNYSQLSSLPVGRSNLVFIATQLQNNWLSWIGWNPALFPWTVIALMGALLAYFSIQYQTVLPWSAPIAPHHISFFWNEVRRIIDLNFQVGSRLFIVLNIVLGTLWLNFLIYPTAWDPYNLFYSVFTASFLFLLFYTTTFQKIINWFEDRKVRQGWQLCFLFASVLTVILLCNFMIDIAKPQLISPLFLLFLNPLPLIQRPNFIYTSLLRFSFWILAVPLASSWLVRVSQGRTIRQFFIGVLSIPLIVGSLIWLMRTEKWVIPLAAFHFPFSLYLSTFIGLVTLGLLIQRVDITDYLWLGYFPCYPLKKDYRSPVEQLWILTIGLLALNLAFSSQGLALSVMPFVLPLWLVFLFTALRGLFSRKHEHHTSISNI